MNQTEFLLANGWLIALAVSVGVISWTILLLKAVFDDKRIALVGVFASLLVAFIAAFPQWLVFATWLKYLAGVLCLVFMIWVWLRHWRKAGVYLPVMGVLLSSVAGYWLMTEYRLLG
ncbi:hypothetical protein ACFODZ_06710 [Marinicella sediminis]|uniref:Uncharacterized protein n=1 Tax=Marinicella sediminis TaxID=1792834 RepID=A0ABV7JCU5_9GAMM|nr:hypothetical protein [Marinicella sediminis]